jgi:hypothetical protein
MMLQTFEGTQSFQKNVLVYLTSKQKGDAR